MSKGHWKVTLTDGSVNDDPRITDFYVEGLIIKWDAGCRYMQPLFVTQLAMLASAEWIEDEPEGPTIEKCST